MINIDILEKEIVKAIDMEKQYLNSQVVEEAEETVDDSFNDLKRFVKKCFKEYREG